MNDDEDQPFFSIITATFRAARTIGALRDSVLEQTCPSWEWIVQDAASDEGTVGEAEAVPDKRIRARSEADGGIYDGLNRALARARGRWILILGADDRLADADVLSRLHTVIDNAGSGLDVVLAQTRIGDHEVFRSSIGPKTLVVNTVHHQGAAYAAEQFRTFAFDQNARVVADYEHSLRLFLQRSRGVRTDLTISVCGAEGVSRTSCERELYGEMHLLRSKYLPRPVSKTLQIAGMTNVRRRAISRGLRKRLGSRT